MSTTPINGAVAPRPTVSTPSTTPVETTATTTAPAATNTVVPSTADGFETGSTGSTTAAEGTGTPLPTLPLETSTNGKPAAKHPAIQPVQNWWPRRDDWIPPVDFNHPVSAEVKQLYPIFAPTPPTNGGEFNSRLETESKIAVPMEAMDGFRGKLEDLVNNPQLVEQLFGPGWTVKRAERYFEGQQVPVLDQNGQPVLDETGKPKMQLQLMTDEKGLPKAKVMKDVVYDDDNYNHTKSRSILRFREFEGDKFNMVNFKPGFGRWDGNIINRIEYALLAAPGIKDHPEQLADFFESDEHLNFFRFAYDAAPGVNAKELKAKFDNADTRYRYMLENKDKLAEIELSLDHVKGSARNVLDENGNPKVVEFGQLEAEVSHTNIKGGEWDLTDPEQAKQVKEMMEKAKAEGLLPPNGKFSPPIHVPDDVNNKPLRETESYTDFQDVVSKFTDFMYGTEFPVVRGEQKARKIADLTGVADGWTN
ncbi:MAG: hypothetical protein ACT4TC_03070 [Myxococcaceae bacterium]